jgi:hypothetical protein
VPRRAHSRVSVHERGLARADIAREQGIVATQIEAPQAVVEGAPIEDFEAGQAKACPLGRDTDLEK